MAEQLAGNTSANIAEVEAANKALRNVVWPRDYGSLGVYSLAGVSGTMAAGLAADANVFSMRYTGSNLVLLTRLLISAGNTSTAFTAGVVKFSAFVARSFSASDSSGTALTITGNNAKLKTSMASTGFGDARISSTAALTAGTRTLDANPFASVVGSIPATAGTPLIPPTELWRANPGDYPLVLANNEGVVIQAVVPATGTWTFAVQAVWEELAAFM